MLGPSVDGEKMPSRRGCRFVTGSFSVFTESKLRKMRKRRFASPSHGNSLSHLTFVEAAPAGKHHVCNRRADEGSFGEGLGAVNVAGACDLWLAESDRGR